MSIIPLSTLISTIHCIAPHTTPSASALQVSSVPDPFVSPTLQLVDGNLSSEVVFVRSPAAVGKSVTAQYLSSSTNAPLLNLSVIPVGTGSLQGLISEYAPNGAQLFHNGELTVVVDALDEGRLLSGETSLEAFLSSLVDYIKQQRSVLDHPKLIFFGREESADFSRLAIEIDGEDITVCTLALDFFDQNSASELIDLYATKEIDRLFHSNVLSEHDHSRRIGILQGGPIQELKAAYFSAIAQALEIPPDQLWDIPRGRTFAGYAPVLASIGTLLADVENPVVVTNRLRATETREAWDVIDSVIQEILIREKKKLVDTLGEIEAVPENAYDAHEQLSYLLQLIGGARRIELMHDVSFASQKDANIYLEKVNQISREHPFIRSGEMTNEVLGSVVFSHGICRGMNLDNEVYSTLLRELSESPFLWRAARREMLEGGQILVEGRYVGYLLHSYWNDPMEEAAQCQQIHIWEDERDIMKVSIPLRATEELTFGAVSPIHMYGRVRDCEVKAFDSDFVIEGATLKQGRSTSLLRFEGCNAVVCRDLHFVSTSTDVSGTLWLSAETVITEVANPQIRTKGDFEYGWGGAVGTSEPWKDLEMPTLVNPYQQTLVAQLFLDCENNIPSSGIVVMGDYSVPEGDNQLAWTKVYGEAFPEFLKLLVEKRLAERDLVPSRRRENKFRIKVHNLSWDELRLEANGIVADEEQVRSLVAEVRAMLGE